MMTDEQARQAFEVWIAVTPLTTVPHSGGYTRESLKWAYQAALSTRAPANPADTDKVRREALEEAARVADSFSSYVTAEQIRALADKGV
jgi:hypothetical protein